MSKIWKKFLKIKQFSDHFDYLFNKYIDYTSFKKIVEFDNRLAHIFSIVYISEGIWQLIHSFNQNL